MVEGLKQRCHGVHLRRDEDDEELFDSDPFSSNSDDEDETCSTPNPSSLSPQLNSNRPLYELSSLMEQLPIKRGLSKYYQGKSQSYTSLSVVSSIDDLPKKETAYRRKMKTCKSYAGGMDARHKSAHSPGHCSKTISKKDAEQEYLRATTLRIPSDLGLCAGRNLVEHPRPSRLCMKVSCAHGPEPNRANSNIIDISHKKENLDLTVRI
ncbi:Rna binding protein [Musa troglodytarum]|uniref:Rna binding protein n=1 Tax=Musa troglodytarum TaxID=320322 RepID=A0A9E7GIW3_9LILI|nr:Rna binding protein [Musa troglodytarum]